VGTTRGREVPVEEGSTPAMEEALVRCAVVADDMTVVANSVNAGAPVKGAPIVAGEGDEQLAPGKQPVPITGRSAPGECGGDVGVPGVPVGAANVAAGDGVAVVPTIDGVTDIR
jgi:hypothetical protein